jgi:hypothetical protein
MATENPSELFSRQLSKTCGMNLMIEMDNWIVETKYSQSKRTKLPIQTNIAPVIAAVQATAMRILKIKDG